jgi:Cu+-exporting ATPase
MDQHHPGRDATKGSCCGCGSKPADGLVATTVTDPVCGMQVDPVMSKHRLDHAGATYNFCSAGCRTKFEADPDKYLAPKADIPAAAPAQADAIYTCPMHPQIRQKGPGSCPICGMALEPVEITAEVGPSHELADMTRRFWVGLVLALPVFILEMGGHIPALGLHRMVPPQISI